MSNKKSFIIALIISLISAISIDVILGYDARNWEFWVIHTPVCIMLNIIIDIFVIKIT